MIEKKSILLIDDDEDMKILCKKYIENGGHRFVSASTAQDGLDRISQGDIDLILLDYMLPGMNGHDLYMTLLSDEKYQKYQDIPVIILTVLTEEIAHKEELLNRGVSLFLQKPFGFKELMNIIANIFMKANSKESLQELQRKKLEEERKLIEENNRLKSQIRESFHSSNMVGISRPMRKLFSRVIDIAKTDANILIQGEKGVGKEFIARSIHAHSKRQDGPFMSINCADLPSALLEGELFGFMKGAFTDETPPKTGLLKLAHKGTLYIEEISRLDIKLQEKIIAVLRTRQFTPFGGKKEEHIDIRIISTTTENLEKAMLKNMLREDLYYRLNVISFKIPPLRERIEDIPLLVRYFASRFCELNHRDKLRFTSEAISCLQSYHWPGNVSELHTLIERLVSMNHKSLIKLRDLPEELKENYELHTDIISANIPLKEARKKWVAKFERTYLLNMLAKFNGNISKVARTAKVNRMTIYRMINYYDISFNKSTLNRN